MDKRIEKTRFKIFDSLKNLLNKKSYSDIVIQDILEESKISRSTFYSHYKTKEDVLEDLCSSIFDHVFSHSLEEERSHDFSKSSLLDYRHFITHIFYHLLDEKDIIIPILSSQSKDIFLNLLRRDFKSFAKTCIQNNFIKKQNVPESLQIDLLIEEFIIVLNYYVSRKFIDDPEEITNLFINLAM